MSEMKDLLKFPDLVPVDHPRHCQQYSNVVNRPADDVVMLDEIDNLQMDLETLLAAASSRMRQLNTEIQILSDIGETKKEKKKEGDQKRLRPQEDRPTKKLKSSDSPAHKYTFPNASTSAGRPKTKGTPSRVQEYDQAEDQQSAQPTRVPINDAPNKFWQSIEPYCAPIQHETIRMLEHMCQSQQDQDDYIKVPSITISCFVCIAPARLPHDFHLQIPELGVHFSQRWALEDMREEQGEGNRANVKSFDKTDSSVQAVLKKAASSMESDDLCPFGSLTQRLISAFVEENIMVPPDRAASMLEPVKLSDASGTDGAGNVIKPTKAMSVPHTHKLEARIKMELIDQGILEPETAESKKEDEILSELKQCQQELKSVTKQNHDVLQQLLQVAKEEMKKEEIRKKIDATNTEVMEHYRRVMAARQKKRSLLKKEKEAAWKALRDREALVKQLD